jgi:hypothetical protein
MYADNFSAQEALGKPGRHHWRIALGAEAADHLGDLMATARLNDDVRFFDRLC